MAGNLLERHASDRRSRSAFSSCHLDISCAPDQGSQCRQAVKALLITGQTLLTDPRRPGGLPDRYATRPKIKHGTAGDQLRALRTINSCVQDPSRPSLCDGGKVSGDAWNVVTSFLYAGRSFGFARPSSHSIRWFTRAGSNLALMGARRINLVS
jgi:hypothetical protein